MKELKKSMPWPLITCVKDPSFDSKSSIKIFAIEQSHAYLFFEDEKIDKNDVETLKLMVGSHYVFTSNPKYSNSMYSLIFWVVKIQ